MCFLGGGNSALPKAPAATPAPTPGTVTAGSIVDPLADPTKQAAAAATALNRNRELTARRMGVFGNVRTSPMGDTTYGTATLGGNVATFGKPQLKAAA